MLQRKAVFPYEGNGTKYVDPIFVLLNIAQDLIPGFNCFRHPFEVFIKRCTAIQRGIEAPHVRSIWMPENVFIASKNDKGRGHA